MRIECGFHNHRIAPGFPEGIQAALAKRLPKVIVGSSHRFRHRSVQPGVSDKQQLFHPLRKADGKIQADSGPHGDTREYGFFQFQMVQQADHILPQPVKAEAFPVRAAVTMTLLIGADQTHTGNGLIDPLNLPDAAAQAMKKHQGATLPGHFIFQPDAAMGKRIHHTIALFKNATLFSIWDWASPWSSRGPW